MWRYWSSYLNKLLSLTCTFTLLPWSVHVPRFHNGFCVVIYFFFHFLKHFILRYEPNNHCIVLISVAAAKHGSTLNDCNVLVVSLVILNTNWDESRYIFLPSLDIVYYAVAVAWPQNFILPGVCSTDSFGPVNFLSIINESTWMFVWHVTDITCYLYHNFMDQRVFPFVIHRRITMLFWIMKKKIQKKKV